MGRALGSSPFLDFFLKVCRAFRSEMNPEKGCGDWWIHWDVMNRQWLGFWPCREHEDAVMRKASWESLFDP